MPLLWTFAHWKAGRYVKYGCLASFFFYFVPRTLCAVPQLSAYSRYLLPFTFPLNSFACYILLGYGLTQMRRRPPVWLLLAGWALTVGAAAGWNAFYTLRTGDSSDLIYEITTVFSCLEAMFVFLLFRRLGERRFPPRLAGLLYRGAQGTLTVYLLHVFVLEHLKSWLGWSPVSFTPVLSVPVFSLLVFLLCLPFAALLRRIPRVGSWIA